MLSQAILDPEDKNSEHVTKEIHVQHDKPT